MVDRMSGLKGKAIGIGKLVGFLALLDFFFVAISLLGAFKDLGHGYGEVMIQQLAANPIAGLLLGILVTSVIQSSSTTTSLVVALAAGGAFGDDHVQTIAMAVPLIMGANIGTSVTNTLVSLGMLGSRSEFERAFSCAIVHDFFNLMAVILFFPLQVLSNFLGRLSLLLAEAFAAVGGLDFVSPIKVLVSPQSSWVNSVFARTVPMELMVYFVGFVALLFGLTILMHRVAANRGVLGAVVAMSAAFAGAIVFNRHSEALFTPETATFLFGLCLLFASLATIVKLMKTVVLARAESLFHDYIFKTPRRSMAVGVLVTAGVQSSSVTTSIVIPMAGAGIVNIHQIFPYTLGANVGTTITAILAALSAGEVTGIAVAFAHLLFNVFGILVIYPMRRVPIGLALAFARVSSRSKAVPVISVLGLYILLPLLVLAILF